MNTCVARWTSGPFRIRSVGLSTRCLSNNAKHAAQVEANVTRKVGAIPIARSREVSTTMGRREIKHSNIDSDSMDYRVIHQPLIDRSSEQDSLTRNFSGTPPGFDKKSETIVLDEFILEPPKNKGDSMMLVGIGVRANIYESNPDKSEQRESKPNGNARISIPNMWLRDHCQCSECVHPVTKQRLLDIFKLPSDPSIEEGWTNDSFVDIKWKDGHRSSYSTGWLEQAFNTPQVRAVRTGHISPVSWDTARVCSEPPEVKFEDVMNSDSGVRDWTRKIKELGFCFVDGCPPTPEATEKLLNRIGPIRNTHYGAFWDFTSDLSSKDMAYTDLALDPHTDTTYFSEPAGLQMFHLLEHEGHGGETQLVDGFHAALRMYKDNEDLYQILSTQRCFFHASGNEGISIQPDEAYPILGHDQASGSLKQIRWNTADRGAALLEAGRGSDSKLVDWYHAMRQFDHIIKTDHPELRFEFQLMPGRPLIFDNWRVLHGRSAFTGRRRMCGGYINRDDFISRFKTSNYGYENILKSGIY